MEEILNKIYTNDKYRLTSDILSLHEKQGFVVSNFLYFAIIKMQKLIESGKKTTIQKEYKKALLKWDFLLPDGIALQLFYKVLSYKYWLSSKKLYNLNGTDFTPFFLDEIKKKYGSQKICISLYWSKKEIVQETEKYLKYKWFNVTYIQDWYTEFERNNFIQAQKNFQDTINILLVARSTVDKPIQELWTLKSLNKIKENNLIVFNVWWLFDFWAAEISKWKSGTQKRAPKFIRTLKLEWLWRLITDPKRNMRKVKNSLYVFPYVFNYLLLKKG